MINYDFVAFEQDTEQPVYQCSQIITINVHFLESVINRGSYMSAYVLLNL